MNVPRGIRGPLSLLVVVHISALLAGFLAPYNFVDQDRSLSLSPPSKVHLSDSQGKPHWPPFVYRLIERPGHFGEYLEDTSQRYGIGFLVRSSEYRAFGVYSSNIHLFGVSPPARLCLMGTDSYGRDVFSRLLYGGQISLFTGLLAAGLSLFLATMLGTVAGYYGHWIDATIMRIDELFLALPWLYLLLGLRAFLPLRISPGQAFLLLIIVIGIVGWARPGRLIRGIVLSAKERTYVRAARSFGASDSYVIVHHILPQTRSVILTQAALLIPQYMLAEVTLSFLGLGVGEPTASWGSMLAPLQSYHVLASCWWMFFPGLVLITIFLSYGTILRALQQGGFS